MKTARNQLEAAVNFQFFFSLMFNLMPLDFSAHKSRSNSLEIKDTVWHTGGLNTSVIQMPFNNGHLIGENLLGEAKICYSLCQATALPLLLQGVQVSHMKHNSIQNQTTPQQREKNLTQKHIITSMFKFISCQQLQSKK